MNSKKLMLTIRTVSMALFTGLFIVGCGGGSSGNNSSPIANAGPDIQARFGSEVVLSGRDSYDNDGPIMDYQWQQVTGPSVDFVNLSKANIKFTIPDNIAESDLVFELSVTDNRNKTNSDRVTVSAVGPVDANRFLTYFSAPQDYVVEVALDNGVASLTADISFDLVMTVTQTYQTLTGSQATRIIESQTKSGAWTAAQQVAGTYPRFGFDIPEARIEDLDDVNKSARNDIDLVIDLSLQNVTGSVDYIIQILNNQGEPISNTDIAATELVALNLPTPDGVSIDVNALLDSLGNDLAESKNTALAYYAAIDPDNEKTTLQDWLTANIYNEDNVTRARYLNGFDLAFGRDMRVWQNDQGHVFAFVENYPSVDSMVNGTNHLGTVAMEYSPGPSGGDPYTKFYTFIQDPETGQQKRVVSMDFDGRGEKFTPGNCAICHGGTPAALVNGIYPNEGNIDGGFLLWDVDTFSFSDAEYEGRMPVDNENQLSKSAQQSAFKTFNEILKQTNLTDAQLDLIAGWYGGENLPNNTFDGSYIPVSWRSPADGGPETNPDTASSFYLEVFAPTCRACHYGLDDGELQFETYADFISVKDDIIHRVFNEGSMPLARITMDNFWVGTQTEAAQSSQTRAALLAEHLGVDIESQQPGSPQAIIESNAVNNDGVTSIPDSEDQQLATVLRGDRVDLSGLASLYAETFNWSLVLPDNSSSTLSATDQSDVNFATDIYGDFIATLTIANNAGVEDSVSYTYRVENMIPEAGSFSASIKESEVAQVNVFNPPTVLGDGDSTDHGIVSVFNEVGGVASIGNNGVISFTPTGSGSAGFNYQIEDVDGDQSASAGDVNITVTALPSASNDNVTVNVGTASDARQTSIDGLANDTLGVEPTTVVALSRTSTNLDNGLNSCSGEQGSLTFNGVTGRFDYTPPVACVGTETYQYTIRDDNSDESSATITFTIGRTSAGAFSNVATAISNNSCAASFCHDDAHVMDLNGSNAAMWADIVECNLNNPDQNTDCALGDRIDLSVPANSLLLQKPLGNLGHGGGGVFSSTSDPDYVRVLKWIEEGAAAP